MKKENTMQFSININKKQRNFLLLPLFFQRD